MRRDVGAGRRLRQAELQGVGAGRRVAGDLPEDPPPGRRVDREAVQQIGRAARIAGHGGGDLR
ncbi:hypothetical protein, partial [Micromonospora sp. 4G55]|uniref:hypothetical protein n=1 Tax=Micromonospora sp. 4G55 TaxID=2806102 RepID=UPI001EE4E8D4